MNWRRLIAASLSTVKSIGERSNPSIYGPGTTSGNSESRGVAATKATTAGAQRFVIVTTLTLDHKLLGLAGFPAAAHVYEDAFETLDSILK